MKSLMKKYDIIKLKKEGWSTNKISKTYRIGRNTVRKYWDEYNEKLNELLSSNPDIDTRSVIESLIEDPKYDASNRGPLKYTEEIDLLLRKILDDEKKKTELLGKNHKQALTNYQIYQLIKNAGFDIGKTTINNKINEIRCNESRETFIKQNYDYCDRFEYDFGEVTLIIDGQKTKGYLAVLTSPASGFRWAYLYHNSKMDVFLDSHARFFEMLGGSFKEGVYDNMRNVVTKFIGRNEKELNEELIKLALYYDFEINVTNCFAGNEKGTVESAVKWIRNKVFAVAYKFDSFEDASSYLQKELVKINKDSKIEEEKKYLKPYRPKYETSNITINNVDKYSFIHVDGNCYSVPEDLCGKTVTVKSYPNEIVVVYKGDRVAVHTRYPGKGKTHVDIRHYLHTFMKKPGALRNSLALKSQPELKAIFDNYYKEKPKVFIEILRESENISFEELKERLVPTENKKYVNENKIIDKTDEQIELIKGLFIGGKHYVN